MKKLTLLLALQFICLMASAQSLVGVWSTSHTEKEKDMEMRMDATRTFAADHTMKDVIRLTMEMDQKEHIKLPIRIEVGGTWAKKDSILTITYDTKSIKSEVESKVLPGMLSSMIKKMLVSEMKKEMKKSKPETIKELTDSKLVLDDDTYKRVR